MNKKQIRKIDVPKPLRFHLRFQIIPGKNVEKDARILVSFCKAHGIEEVVLFFAAEEWNNGLLSAKEEEKWFNTVKKAKSIIDKAGVVVSLNPWQTAGQSDRGRRFPEKSKFKPMVSPCGEISRACASFADSNWCEHTCNTYGRFARLGFRVIWVEDDFRYHNHGTLTWGGGFEPEIIKRFAKKIGHKVTRKEIVRNILKPGKPHPWRAKWMKTWQEIQLEVAENLAKTVAKNAPDQTKIGLMSSLPAVHSIEGRDWQKLFKAFTIDGQVTHRPHYAGYSEYLGKNADYSIMLLDIHKNFRPAGSETAPEVENFSFTRWSKSDSLSWSSMAFCMFYGSDALLLNLFPMTGNSANTEPQIGELLDKTRPALEWISSKFSKDLQTCGVGIPWRENAQAYVHTAKGERMEELDANSLSPGHFLLAYGVPVSANTQEVNAVFGSLAWAFGEREIIKMLSRGLLLDGVSADILCQRGFGEYIGVDSQGLADREDTVYAVEMVKSSATGVEEGFYLNANGSGSMYIFKPREEAVEWTTIITPERKRFGAGIVAYKNEIGGRVVTYSTPDPTCLSRNFQRQVIAQRVIDFLADKSFDSVKVTGNPYLMPMHFKGKNSHFVVIYNGAPDATNVVVRTDTTTVRSIEATLLVPLGKPVKVKVNSIVEKERVTISSQDKLPYLGFLVLEWSKNTT